MQSTRLSAATLLSSLFLFASCGPDAPAADAGGDGGGEVTSDPGEGASALARADELLAAAEYAQVVELLSATGADETLDPETAERLIKALWGVGDDGVPRAVRVAKSALERHPDAVMVSRLLSEIYLSLNQYGSALTILREARENGASDADVSLALGVCLGRMKQLEEARAEFERAKQAGASAVDVDYNMSVLLIEQHQQAEAEGLLRGILEQDASHVDGRRELARVLLHETPVQEDRLVEAIDHINLVLDARETDWRANELMGDALMAAGDPEAAVYFYTEALRHGRNPAHVEDKYRAAETERRALLREHGLWEDTEEGNDQRKGGPPIPESVQERWKQGVRERRAEAAAGSGGAPDPSEGPDGGGEQGH